MATLLRESGGSGVQSHVDTFRTYARSIGRAGTLLPPFSAHAPMLRPVLGARFPVRLASRSAGVWWYRYWHGHYLGRALSEHLAAATGPAVIYAQCPVSAAEALRVRTTQPVVM